MGFDQDHIDRIFLPGQADFHYQHLSIRPDASRVGDRQLGGRRSRRQGPLVGTAQLARKDLPALADRLVRRDRGFMLVRAVGPTRRRAAVSCGTRASSTSLMISTMRNEYAAAPHLELKRTELRIRSGGREWRATGMPQAWLPLRHRQNGRAGQAGVAADREIADRLGAATDGRVRGCASTTI